MQQDIWIYLGVFATAILAGMLIAQWRMNGIYQSPRSRRRSSRASDGRA